MTPALHPYPAYKPSGVDWLGDVPEHWDVRRLKTVCSKFGLYGANVAATQYQEAGVRFLRTTDITDDGQLKDGGVFLSKELARGYVLTDGDVLVSRSGTVGRSFLYESEIHGACSYAGYLVRFVPGSLILPKYIYLFTKTQAFEWFLRVMAILSTIENVNAEKYANAHLPVPPLSEQVAIVRYLDYVDRRVRRYVEAKRKLIALLEEERQAVIHQAVTRGPDPNVPLKPSGVEWLGNIPDHWEVRRGKRLFSPRRELARPNDIQLSATQAYGVVPQDEYEQRVGRRIVKISLHLNKRRHVEVDDFVISMRSFQGGLERAWASGCIRSSYIVLRPTIEVDVEFFSYVFKSQAYIQALQSTANFIRDGQDLNFNNFCAVDLPFPPPEEQRKIAVALGEATAIFNTTIARAQRQIQLLEEYRTRLIADVVTGKLDVRETAASLPHEEDNREPKALDSSPAVAGGALVPAGTLE